MASNDASQIARPESSCLRAAALLAAFALQVASLPASAAGTPAGTIIENRAEVAFDVGPDRLTIGSNTATVQVEERIDVASVTLNNQVSAAPGSSGNVLLFSITNTGNASESFRLSLDNALSGDDFDPIADTPAIYFDTDASGDLSAGDTAYAAGTNDPLLAADESLVILVVNSLPGGLAEGAVGQTSLIAEATTGTGAPGTTVSPGGGGSVAAVLGSSGGSATASGEYLATSVQVAAVKSATVADPFGGDRPVPGAVISYRIEVTVTGANTATNSVVTDPVPADTTYTPGSLTLNGQPQSDAADGDAGEYLGASREVVVRLGDLTAADGTQTIVFEVTID